MLILLPEIFLLSMICVILLLSLVFKSEKSSFIYVLSQISIIGVFSLLLSFYHYPDLYSFDHEIILDKLGLLLKLGMCITSFFVFWFSKQYVKQRQFAEPEYYLLSLFSILGLLLLVSANNVMVLFLSLELSVLPIYALVALRQNSAYATEASLKYFVLGALASGMLLYGLSMIYGVTGSLDISQISQVIHNNYSNNIHSNLILLFGLVFITAGIAFKLGAAPFHVWVPDVYAGAPTSVVLFISSVPKIAALGIAYKLLLYTLPELVAHWQVLLIIIAIASMALGNFAAIVQTNIKRMFGYSSIAHMGYMTLGLLSGLNHGYAAALFYMLVYMLMTLGGFGLLVILSQNNTEIENISDLKGLNSRNPWLAFMMLLVLFSMAGIPPTVGFFAKLWVLESIIQIHLIWLAVLALVFAIIGAYYYINIVKVMYFEETNSQPFCVPANLVWGMSVVSLSILGLGMLPSSLIMLCRTAFPVF